MRVAKLCLLVLLLLPACSDVAEEAELGSFPEPGPECLEPAAAGPTMQRQAIITLGAPNRVVLDQDVAWVVQSDGNTVGRLDLDSGQWAPNFVDLGVGAERLPYDVAPGDGRLYVSNYLTSTISVADGRTGEVLEEVAGSLFSPHGIAVGGGFVAVANTGFDGSWQPASVSVFRVLPEAPYLEPVVDLPTSALNAVEVVYDESRHRFLVVCAGRRSEEDIAQMGSDGAVDVIDVGMLEGGDPASAMFASVPIAMLANDPYSAGPGAMAISEDRRHAYIASSASPAIFKLDLDSLELLRGPEDPIVGYDGVGTQMTAIARGPGPMMYVAAFNIDRLFMLDTRCDYTVSGPYDLGVGPGLEGPLDIAYDAARGQALTLMTVASALTIVKDPPLRR